MKDKRITDLPAAHGIKVGDMAIVWCRHVFGKNAKTIGKIARITRDEFGYSFWYDGVPYDCAVPATATAVAELERHQCSMLNKKQPAGDKPADRL